MKGVKVLVFELEPLGASSRGWGLVDRLEVPTLNHGGYASGGGWFFAPR